MNVLRAAAGMHQRRFQTGLRDNERLISDVHLGAGTACNQSLFRHRLHRPTEAGGIFLRQKSFRRIRQKRRFVDFRDSEEFIASRNTRPGKQIFRLTGRAGRHQTQRHVWKLLTSRKSLLQATPSSRP